MVVIDLKHHERRVTLMLFLRMVAFRLRSNSEIGTPLYVAFLVLRWWNHDWRWGEVENENDIVDDETGGDVADDAFLDLFVNCSDHFTHVHVHKRCQSVVYSVKLGFQEDFGADARGHELAAAVPELNGDVARS